MPLRDVAQLVPQHRRQLVAVADHCNQTHVHTQVAAGQGKSVHRAVAPEHDLPGKALVQFRRQIAPQPGGRQQGLPNALHVVGQHGVVQVVGVAVNFAGNAVAQASFVAAGHVAAIAQRGQLAGRQRCGGRVGLGLQPQRTGHANSYQ